jgi:hypothetical protein
MSFTSRTLHRRVFFGVALTVALASIGLAAPVTSKVRKGAPVLEIP